MPPKLMGAQPREDFPLDQLVIGRVAVVEGIVQARVGVQVVAGPGQVHDPDRTRAVPMHRRGHEILIGTAQVRGLRSGADDYLTKPFGVMELVARVEALLRRTQRSAGPPGRGAIDGVVRIGEIAVDTRARSVLRAGMPVELAPLEFDLLAALVRRRGAVASRREPLAEVWGYADSVISRTVDAHVALLRRKLEPEPAAPR